VAGRASHAGRFLAGATTAGMAAFLAACGSSSSSSGTTTTTAPLKSLALPRPKRSVTWPVYAGQRGHRRRLQPEEERNPQALQLGGVHHQRSSTTPEEVRLQGRGDHLQHDDRGHRQAPIGAVRLRRLHAHGGRPRPARRGQDYPAPHTTPTSPTSPELERVHQSVLRPGLAVHRAVHDLHDRDRLAEGPRGRVARRPGQRLGLPLAGEVQGGRSPSSTTTARDSPSG